MKCATQRKRIRRVPERRIRITGAELGLGEVRSD
jgi:hypothetical protein